MQRKNKRDFSGHTRMYSHGIVLLEPLPVCLNLCHIIKRMAMMIDRIVANVHQRHMNDEVRKKEQKNERHNQKRNYSLIPVEMCVAFRQFTIMQKFQICIQLIRGIYIYYTVHLIMVLNH